MNIAIDFTAVLILRVRSGENHNKFFLATSQNSGYVNVNWKFILKKTLLQQ